MVLQRPDHRLISIRWPSSNLSGAVVAEMTQNLSQGIFHVGHTPLQCVHILLHDWVHSIAWLGCHLGCQPHIVILRVALWEPHLHRHGLGFGLGFGLDHGHLLGILLTFQFGPLDHEGRVVEELQVLCLGRALVCLGEPLQPFDLAGPDLYVGFSQVSLPERHWILIHFLQRHALEDFQRPCGLLSRAHLHQTICKAHRVSHTKEAQRSWWLLWSRAVDGTLADHGLIRWSGNFLSECVLLY